MPQFGPKRGPLFAITLAWISTFIPKLCYCDAVLPTATIPDLSSYISQSTVNAIVKTFGFCMDHRPYEPATSLGSSFDLGIEATVVTPPNDLGSALSSIGSTSSGSTTSTSSSTTVPLVPSAKFHLRRGFGEKMDLGISTLYVPTTLPYVGGTFIIGGDIKYVIASPEEGMTLAIRGSYNFVNLTGSGNGYTLSAKTVTITPQLVLSRKMGFADPYIGTGFQYTYGTISATVPTPPVTLLSGVAIAPVTLALDGGGTGVYFFGGLSLLTGIRFRLTIEGAYNPSGENSLGTKIGFTL